jgi:erythrin-vacuolar iron transport family protein
MKALSELNPQEVLALAIASEEEDSRIYQSFSDKLKEDFPSSARIFSEMAEEERGHRNALYDVYKTKFGEHLPPIRREDVKGFLKRRPVWWSNRLTLDDMRREAEVMEVQAAMFYERAAKISPNVEVRALLTHLAEVERRHESKAGALSEGIGPDEDQRERETQHRLFVLQYVQPGLAGLIDGSVSTLAPLFAAAFATHNNWNTFLVGLAASIGAGISMGLTEALSDDGIITGRGSPWLRGLVCGLMTTIGGLGHTLPYLIPDTWPNAFTIATGIATLVVIVELIAISLIRTRYMETPFFKSTIQVIIGGILVLLTGILIGSA